jgi:hypothetical protein
MKSISPIEPTPTRNGSLSCSFCFPRENMVLAFWIIDFVVDDVPKDAKLWYKRYEIVGKQTIKEMEENSISKKMAKNYVPDSIYQSSVQIKMPKIEKKEFNLNYKNKCVEDTDVLKNLTKEQFIEMNCNE